MATSRSLNKVMLIGNITRDPVLRETSNGGMVSTFGVATNATWKDSDNNVQERTEFHNLVAWNKLAEITAQILSTGMLIYIEGELRTRTWDDESGTRHYKTEVKINDMKLLDSKGKSGIGIDEAKSLSDSSHTDTTESDDEGASKKKSVDEIPAVEKEVVVDDEVSKEAEDLF